MQEVQNSSSHHLFSETCFVSLACTLALFPSNGFLYFPTSSHLSLLLPFQFLSFLCNQHSSTQNRNSSMLSAVPPLQNSPVCCEEYNAFSLVILTLYTLCCITSLQLSATSHSFGLKPLQKEHISVSPGIKTRCLVIGCVLSAKKPKIYNNGNTRP